MLLGIVTDIHEDIVRLEESFALFDARQVDEIVCLGDMVGFGVPFYSYLKTRNSNRVIKLIKGKCAVVVKGNHDLFHIRKTPVNIGQFHYPENWYALDYQKRKEFSGDQIWLYEENDLYSLLTSENMKYIDTLPEYEAKDCGRYKILFSHYAFPDPTGSLTKMIKRRSMDDLCGQFEMMRQCGCLYAFSGHDHYQGIKAFTNDSVIEISFGEKYTLPNQPLWLHVAAAANGTNRNGVAIYDTNTREIEAIPLNSPPHIVT